MAENTDKNPEKEISLFDKALESGYIYYKNGSFEELCDIFRDPRMINVDYVPVRYTTITKDEYIKWEAAKYDSFNSLVPNLALVIFQDKDGVARLGAWNSEA